MSIQYEFMQLHRYNFRTLLKYGFLFTFSAVIIELISIVFIHYRYRYYIEEGIQSKSHWATGMLAGRMLSMFKYADLERITSVPSPFLVPDSLHGYRMRPGAFQLTYQKRSFDTIQRFHFYVRVFEDGNRYVGVPPYPTNRNVFVFGDSFVFGEGVNDEQTFTYLLQSRFPNTRFHLYAYSGYSLSNSYLDFQRLSSRIGPNDIVILGYASYFDIRQVSAPSELKSWGKPRTSKYHPREYSRVRVKLLGDSLLFDKVPIFCADAGGYCDEPDPPKSYMRDVTVRLINSISRSTKAQVFLLNFYDPLHREILEKLDTGIRVINASQDTYDYKMRDDINGFDSHPGPFWHHAIYRRVADTLLNVDVR